ncbi:MAG TPA: D-alanine--D-alanine ligase family protein [Pseudonocardiaceae bacterium]|nr:D-alanine--D-alanine ligase family protein [Pseudonocardiaceae bacterium]
MTERKLRVAVVFGGKNTEHAVSCLSAGSVLSHLDPSRFEVAPIGITVDGAWVLAQQDPKALTTSDGVLPSVTGGTALALPDPRTHELVVMEPERVGEVLGGIDVVFPVLHGAYGEDGTIQGMLELAGIPYAGAGVLASAVAMDKEFGKKLLAAEGLPIGPYVVLRRGVATVDEATMKRFGLPVFVKPARAGSSKGVTRVTDWAELVQAVEHARTVDPKVIVEAAMVGHEVECGVLEYPDGRVDASLPAEVRFVGQGTDWYDFEAKYLDDSCEFDIPAKLSDAVIATVRETAVRAFHALDCQGLARVDFFVGPDDTVTVNEVNTMPGFTETSMFPKMWAVTGVDYGTLLTTIIETAIARGTGLR